MPSGQHGGGSVGASEQTKCPGRWRRPFILGLRLWDSGQASREPLAGAVGACVLLSRMYAIGMPRVREVRPSPPHPESGSKAPKQQSGSRASALQKSRRPSVKAHGANRVPWLRSFVRQPCLQQASDGLSMAAYTPQTPPWTPPPGERL